MEAEELVKISSFYYWEWLFVTAFYLDEFQNNLLFVLIF